MLGKSEKFDSLMNAASSASEEEEAKDNKDEEKQWSKFDVLLL